MKLSHLKKRLIFIVASLAVVLTVILLYEDGMIGSIPQMPEIVFICTKYYDQYEPCSTVFIDKYGKCYCLDDENYDYDNIVDAYKSGKIKEKIKLCGSCSRNEVIKRYRQMCKQAKKEKIYVIPYISILMIQENYPEWKWRGLYFDNAGEIQYVLLHNSLTPGYEEETNNKQINRIYEWCKDIMGDVKMKK